MGKNQEVKLEGNSSVERALAILEFLSKNKPATGIGDISSALGLPKSTTHRLLELLKSRGFVEQMKSNEKYEIGVKAIEVGMSGLKTSWIDIASPYVRNLSEKTGETTLLAVYDEGEVVCLYKMEGSQSIIANVQLGTRKPIHSTALGKAIVSNFTLSEVDKVLSIKEMLRYTDKTITDRQQYLKELSTVREKGYAVGDEEAEEGVTCFAVPIYTYTGQVKAAVSLTGPSVRMNQNRGKAIRNLKESADHISRRLGYVGAMRSSF